LPASAALSQSFVGCSFERSFDALVILIGHEGNTKGADMNVITLKLPDDLNAALNEVSRQRGLSKSAVVREALAQAFLAQGVAASAAERWVAKWQGQLKLADADLQSSDPRLAHLLAKHVK
jgi:predicted transcriptional regulator